MGRPRRQGPLPPEGTKWFDFDITGHQRRKHRHGLVDRNAPRAAPRIWLRLCEGEPLRSDGVLVRCRVLAPGGSTTSCTCPHNAHTRTCRTCTCTCGWGVVVVAVVAGGEPQEKGERCVLCFRIEPAARRPLAADMSAVCPRFQDLGLLGAAGGCWGGRGFHSMVLEESKAHRGERGGNSTAAGRRRIWGSCPWRVCVRVVRERVCLCALVLLHDLSLHDFIISRGTASQHLPTTCYLPQICSKQRRRPA